LEGVVDSDDFAGVRVRYEKILAEGVGVPPYQRPFYWKWLGEFLGFCRIRHLEAGDRSGLDRFLEMLFKSGARRFQIEQARVAVEVYWLHFGSGSKPALAAKVGSEAGMEADKGVLGMPGIGAASEADEHTEVRQKPASAELPGDWRMVLATVAREVGLRRYSKKTLKAYMHWVRDFSRFAGDVPVGALNEAHAKGFLTHLAMERKVAAATQNQAFSALLFLYTNVLRIDMQGMAMTPRAARRQEIPTALTRGEVQAMLSALEYSYKLFCQLLYGCGLRLSEGLTLRVQDLDLEGGALRVHHGKGEKSRSVPLPKTLIPGLVRHLESVRGVFDSDVKVGYAGVFLPGLLDRKLPGAARSWPWQWVFPGGRLTVTEGDGKLRRFHLHESSVQKEIKSAAEALKMAKRVTAHTFRHSYATHLLQMGYDIRTVQELMGHNDVETTMIYTHVLQAMSGKVISPLDV
jgi:integron integrase